MCFVRVFSVFCACSALFMFSDQHPASQHVFPSRVARNRRGIGAVHTVWSPNNTKHAKYTHKTRKHC